MDRNGSRSINLIKWSGYGLMLVPLLFMAVFFFYPVLSIFDLSLRPNGTWDLSGFADLVTSRYYRNIVFFSFWQASLSTILTMLLALPAAYVFTRFDFPAKNFLLTLSNLPFVLPTVVVAAAFSALIGTNGVMNTWLMAWFHLESAPIQLERTLGIILLAHVFYNYSVALRMITGYWANQSTRIEEAARLLGAAGWRLWWYVRLPMLRPALLASSILIFIFTFTSFGVVLILGGIRFATLEVQIYYQALNIFDLPLAAALSLVQILMMFVMMLVYTRLQKNISSDLQASQQIARSPRTWREYFLVGSNLAILLLLLFVPLLALIYRSLRHEGAWTLRYYLALWDNPRGSVLFESPFTAIQTSVSYASMTTLLALSLGLLSAYLIRRGDIPVKRTAYMPSLQGFYQALDPIFMLPLATSAVTLGLGYIIALDSPPLDLRASWLIIPIAHTLVAMPFVVRSILPALRRIPPNLRESAQVLGAQPLRVWWWIEMGLIRRALLVGATFAFSVSMGEFGASLFVARRSLTMPLVIFRLLGQPGATNYGQAMALSCLLMLVCALSFIIIERFGKAEIGEF